MIQVAFRENLVFRFDLLTKPGRLSGSSQVVKASLTPTSSASNLVAKICHLTDKTERLVRENDHFTTAKMVPRKLQEVCSCSKNVGAVVNGFRKVDSSLAAGRFVGQTEKGMFMSPMSNISKPPRRHRMHATVMV